MYDTTVIIAGIMIMVMNWLIPSLGIGWSVVLAGMVTGILLGGVAGVFNGLMITRGRIEAFIVTLGTMGIFRSLVTFLADGGTLSLNFNVADVYRPVYYDGLLGVPYPIIVFALVAIGGEIAMRYTAFGRYCAAIGSNEQVARYSSINVENVRLLTYVLQGVLVGVAVLLYVPRLGSASSTTGVLWELEAIAGVIIGGTTLKGGYGRIWGTVVGVVNVPIIKYSVEWWNSLHQTPTVMQMGKPKMDGEMLWPLLLMFVAFALYFVAVLLTRLRAELLRRERNASWIREVVA